MEKQLEELVNIMIEREREMNKQTITLSELRRENQEQKSKTQHIEKEFNNLLKRTIYAQRAKYEKYRTIESWYIRANKRI